MLCYYTQLDTSKLYGVIIPDVSNAGPFSVKDLVLRLKQCNKRASQAYTTIGRPVHRRRGAKAWNLQAGQREGRGLHQRLEHRAATSLLPLSSQALCIFLSRKQ
jgi:hypothetical protein